MTLRTSEQMLELLKAWAIEFESVEQLEGNRVGLYIAIAKTGQRYVVKEVGDVVWRQTYAGNLNWQEKTEIQYRVMRHVNRRGVPTGHLLTTRDGKGYAIAWDSVFTLMPFISVEASPGFLKPDTVVWSNTGRSYAHLHAALTTFDDPIEIPLLTLYDRYEVKTRTRENVIQGSDLDFKKEFLIDLEPHVSEQSSKLPEQPTIWDAHTGNTCYMDGQLSGFIDFDEVCIGPRILDLAGFAVVMILWDQSPSRTRPWLTGLPHMLRSYHASNPLSDIERVNLPLALEVYALYRSWLPKQDDPPERIEESRKVIGTMRWLVENRETVRNTIASAF